MKIILLLLLSLGSAYATNEDWQKQRALECKQMGCHCDQEHTPSYCYEKPQVCCKGVNPHWQSMKGCQKNALGNMITCPDGVYGRVDQQPSQFDSNYVYVEKELHTQEQLEIRDYYKPGSTNRMPASYAPDVARDDQLEYVIITPPSVSDDVDHLD